MKSPASILFAIALLNISTTVKAGENDAMVDMMMNMLKQSGQIGSVSNCLGVTESDATKAYKKLFEFCIPKDGLEGDCMESLAAEYFGVSQEQVLSCSDDDDEIAEQEEEIDFANLSDEERVEALNKRQAEGLARLEEIAAFVKKSSEGTEGKITLPIYNPSSLVVHHAKGMQNSKGKTTLPMATFTSKASVDEVADFYKKSLPDFEIDHSQSVYTLMKDMPKDLFKLSLDMENLPLYFIPHIEIYSMKISGEKTTHIVITYQPS